MARKQSNTPPGADALDPGNFVLDVQAAEALASRTASELAGPAIPDIAAAVNPLGGLSADVSGDLAAAAPSFGNVLKAIGTGVAESQAALDKGLLDTIQALGGSEIEIVTEVVEKLGEDGLPVAAETQLNTSKVSLLSISPPAAHQWTSVELAMDLSIGAMDSQSGLIFDRTQWSNEARGTYTWGFGGWFSAETNVSHSVTAQVSRSQAEWTRGMVKVDALLSKRKTGNLPAPTEVVIGPRIFLSLGTLKETKVNKVVTERSIDLLIHVVKADGSPNGGRVIDVEVPSFVLFSFLDDNEFDGQETNAEGKVKMTLTRPIPEPIYQRPVKIPVRVSLKDVVRTLEVTL